MNDEVNAIMAPLNDLKFEELDEYSYEPDEIANVTWAKPADNHDEFYCQMTGYDAGYIYKCKMGKLNEDGAIDENEPIDSFELMDEEPISSWIETDQRIYAGYKNEKFELFIWKTIRTPKKFFVKDSKIIIR